MINLEQLTLRQLQIEAAKALSVIPGDNATLSPFNKKANHDSQNFYRAIIEYYINEYGDIPSNAGPAQSVRLVLDK